MTSISQFQYPVSPSSTTTALKSNLEVPSDLSTSHPTTVLSESYGIDSAPATIESTTTKPIKSIPRQQPAAEEDPALAQEGEYSDDDDDNQALPLLDESDVLDEEEDLDDDVPIAVRLTTDTKTLELFNTASFVQSSNDISFSSSDASSVLFRDQVHLFREPLHLFMEALQSELGLVNDISLYFPQLQLKFHTHMPFSESLSLLDLSFLASKANSDYDNVLTIRLSEESNNFVIQYNRLLDLAEDGTESEDEDDDEGDNQGSDLLAKRSRESESEENTKRQRLRVEVILDAEVNV